MYVTFVNNGNQYTMDNEGKEYYTYCTTTVYNFWTSKGHSCMKTVILYRWMLTQIHANISKYILLPVGWWHKEWTALQTGWTNQKFTTWPNCTYINDNDICMGKRENKFMQEQISLLLLSYILSTLDFYCKGIELHYNKWMSIYPLLQIPCLDAN